MRFWISWYSKEDPENVPFHAWETGERVNADFSTRDYSICAVIDAESEQAAYDLARQYYPDLEERFCTPKADDFQPGDRFPKEVDPSPDDSALLGPITRPRQDVNAFFAKAAQSVRDYGGHECSKCGTRWQSPDHSSCPCCDDTPLPDDDAIGLVEHAEHIADGLESGEIVLIDDDGMPVPFVDEDLPGDAAEAVMFLDFEHAAFMDQVCRFEGLLVYLHQTDELRMAETLEAGGLVTIDRGEVFWVVSAVRDNDGE